MPTYEYQCENCGLRFECQQAITEAPIEECTNCHGKVHRLVSGGAGFIFKGSGQGRAGLSGGQCSLEQGGRTCCGRSERCDSPPCDQKGNSL